MILLESNFLRFVVVLLAALTMSCALTNPMGMADTANLQLFYVSGGDLPTITTLRFYHPNTLEIEPLGHRVRRERLSRSDAGRIIELLTDQELRAELNREKNLGTAIRRIDHEPAILLRVYGIDLQKEMYQLPPKSRQLIVEVDEIARRSMPKAAFYLDPRIGVRP